MMQKAKNRARWGLMADGPSKTVSQRYEEFLESPVNSSLELLETLELPRHPHIMDILSKIESKQLQQVSRWVEQ